MYIEKISKNENVIKTFVETYLGYQLASQKVLKTASGELVMRVSILKDGLTKPMNYEFSDYTVRALRSGAVKVAKTFEATLENDWHNFLGFKFENYIKNLNNWLDNKKLEVY